MGKEWRRLLHQVWAGGSNGEQLGTTRRHGKEESGGLVLMYAGR